MSVADGGDRNEVVAQIHRSFVLQTPANHNSKLVLDSLGDVSATDREVDSTGHGRTMEREAFAVMVSLKKRNAICAHIVVYSNHNLLTYVIDCTFDALVYRNA